MKHKVLIESISLLSPLTGIGRYTYEIAKKIEKNDKFKSNYFYGYYSKKLLDPSIGKDIRPFKSIISKKPFLKKIARKIITLSSKFFAPTYDLYWQPNFIPNPNIKSKKTVTTVHDFSFILHKDFHPKERIDYFQNNFFKNIIKSDMIITGSEFSKNEIQERLDFDKNKIRVIYHGIDHNIFKVYDNASVDFELPKKFILSVGSVEPRKNLLTLLKAYNSLDNSTKQEFNLVIVGFKGWENNEIMEQIAKTKENIHYLGFISDLELANIYNKASLFVFPSFYEGFGLPVLEAMACGTPVVCSNSSSIPEVGGDAVIYCDPYSAEDIKVKIELVLNDKELQNKLISKGLKRAQLFSWEKSANEHIKLFEKLINEK